MKILLYRRIATEIAETKTAWSAFKFDCFKKQLVSAVNRETFKWTPDELIDYLKALPLDNEEQWVLAIMTVQMCEEVKPEFNNVEEPETMLSKTELAAVTLEQTQAEDRKSNLIEYLTQKWSTVDNTSLSKVNGATFMQILPLINSEGNITKDDEKTLQLFIELLGKMFSDITQSQNLQSSKTRILKWADGIPEDIDGATPQGAELASDAIRSADRNRLNSEPLSVGISRPGSSGTGSLLGCFLSPEPSPQDGRVLKLSRHVEAPHTGTPSEKSQTSV